jgi:hypothetical protein
MLTLGCACIFRIACLTNMTFVEELIGENIIRMCLVGISSIIATMVCVVEIGSGDIKTGLSFNMVTKSDVPTGKSIGLLNMLVL